MNMTITAITNAAVFDGENTIGIKTVVVEDDLITGLSSSEASTPGGIESIVDGSGCTLLPGLIDSHAHLYDRVADLETCAKNGVTTLLDMGNRDYRFVDRLREVPRAASVFSVLGVAYAPGSTMLKAMYFPEDCGVKDSVDAIRFVDDQVDRGADFIKIILEDPMQNNGIKWPFEVAKALVDRAHEAKKLVIAHAVTPDSYLEALQFGVDEISHVPFVPLPQSTLDELIAHKVTIVPTLTMMSTIAQKLNESFGIPITADFCFKTVAEFHRAGVNILAGTDANFDDPPSMATPMVYGSSLHRELGYLVQVGLGPREALAAATSRPADFFGLSDRGRIAVGKRADLYLCKGNPSEEIADICKAVQVWVAGEEVL
ncbi:MAG: amidohydrolase family protein [Coriobacteriales bacterium]|jgi:imidazolonepropionase-like amidohydrolase|nr:amidohydrolase family protein [Coriobacteriales bacterium]